MPAKPRFSSEQLEAAYELLKDATRAHPVTSEQLEKAVRLPHVEGNLGGRTLIHEVMKAKRLPLVATSGGYFVPTTYEEVKEYVEGLQRRSLGNMGRAALVDVLWHETHPTDEENQTTLEDEW
jgi:hypothetical protein